MDILIPVVIIVAIVGLFIKKFKPELWEKAVSKFKK